MQPANGKPPETQPRGAHSPTALHQAGAPVRLEDYGKESVEELDLTAAGNNLPQLACLRRTLLEFRSIGRSQHDDHPDAEIEDATHLGGCNAAGFLDQLEQRRNLPSGRIDLYIPAEADAAERPDLAPASGSGGRASSLSESDSVAPTAIVTVDGEPRLPRALLAIGAQLSDSEGEAALEQVDWLFVEADPERIDGGLAALSDEFDGRAARLADLGDGLEAFVGRGGTLLVAPLSSAGQAPAGPPPAPRSTPGSRVVAVTDEATPLAFADGVGDGCVVVLTSPWADVADRQEAGLPDFLATLIRGCRNGLPPSPLDSGARATLTRADLPARVTAAQLDGVGPRLTPWIFLVLLILLGTEVALTSSRWQRRSAPTGVTVGEGP